jgi:hypothetical protein
LEVLLRKTALLAVIAGFCFLTGLAQAQQGDASFGFGTIMSNGSNACSFTSCLVAEKGGLYPNINADVIFHRRVGFDFEAAWKASQGAYGGPGGQPFRPIILDFNAMYQPKLGKKAGLELLAGIGWQSTRFYLPFCTNAFTCNNFTSTHHFLVDVGGGIRYYVWGHFFVRPEIRFYKINNNVEFSSGNIFRAGASIGYTIGPD